jgi:hypothetical protein
MRRADTHHKRGNRLHCAQVRIGPALSEPVRPMCVLADCTCEHDDWAAGRVPLTGPGVPVSRAGAPVTLFGGLWGLC